MADSSIPSELRRLRVAHGWTQAELAERLGIDTSAVTHIERGTRNPGFEILTAWVAAAGAAIRVEGPGGPDPLASLWDAERQLVLLARQLEPADRDRLLRVATAFAELPAEARPLVAEQLELQVRMMKARV